jgi:integrase/recombinase XerD
MKANPDFSVLCESFFAKRLIAQRKASQHTISAYAYTFRLLLKFAQKRLGIPPSKLTLADLNAPLLAEFLDDLEVSRANGARSRNARLAAIRSFYHYAALEAPQHSGLIHGCWRYRISDFPGVWSITSLDPKSKPSWARRTRKPGSADAITRSF